MKTIVEALPVIQSLENESLVAQEVIYEREASLGKGAGIEPKTK